VSAGALACLSVVAASGQGTRATGDTTPKLDIYGSGQADVIFDLRRNDPNWFDVNRPSKLPSSRTEFGANGHAYVSPRASRFGVKGVLPTAHGDVLAQFEIDMFGDGEDAGQTTSHLCLAYGQWGRFGGGQLWSPFMDIDVFPNILDYWGPNGLVFFRNALVFWQPIEHGETRLTFGLERPGATGDAGVYADRIELTNVTPRFPVPDFSAGYRTGGKWGYVKVVGIVRDIRWDQVPTDTFDLSGHVTGWGATVSSSIKRREADVIRLQVTYGEGIQNYFNDAPVDVGIKNNASNRRTPVVGVPLPIFGAVAFLEHSWNSTWTSSTGWSMVNIGNSDAQAPSAFHNGQYAIGNLIWTPNASVLMGAEFQYGRRVNFSDNFTFDDYRLQFSFKYSFSQHIGGTP
jgi:hypothetical protein